MILFDQNEEIIIGYGGKRLVKCKICGKIDHEENFSCYGGIGELNKGKCRDCVLKMDGYKGVRK